MEFFLNFLAATLFFCTLFLTFNEVDIGIPIVTEPGIVSSLMEFLTTGNPGIFQTTLGIFLNLATQGTRTENFTHFFHRGSCGKMSQRVNIERTV